MTLTSPGVWHRQWLPRRRHARMTALVAAVTLAVTGFSVTAPSASQASTATAPAPAAAPKPVSDPASYVNPLIGTGSGGDIVGSINEFPGADLPFGMLSWSPDTSGTESQTGYYYDDTAIKGFSLTHLSGAGCPVMGDIPFLPTTGAVPANPQAATSPFSHDTEKASAGYYGVTLGDSGIRAQLTTTLRTGIGKFTYPAGTTAANMLIKAGDSVSADQASSVQVVGNDEVVGSVTTGHTCNLPNTYTVYFAAVFDHPFTASGTWTGSAVTPGSTQASAANAGAYVSFDTSASPVVQVKTAVSYVSVAGAQANLAAEQPGWDFSGTHQAAVAAWNRELSKIKVGGGTTGQLQTFYTALYHAMLDPNVFSDASGQYMGFDGTVHQLPAGHEQYANYSGWDIYRSETSLLALINPAQASDMAQSLVNDAAQGGGWLPKWPVADAPSAAMNGDSADPILANFAAYGGSSFNTTAALADMIQGATDTTSPPGPADYVERPDLASYLQDGYVPNTDTTDISDIPNGASETLEYAIDDFAISQFAQSLGRKATASTYLERSQNWTNLFNTGSGFIQPRDASGQFPAGNPQTTGLTTFGQSGFQEGNATQYSWMVPQDLAGLFTAMGGNAAVVKRLNTFFTQLNAGPNAPFMWSGNEPSLDTPWEYDYAGAPYRTQDVVRQIMTQLYGPTPEGAPGNDDLGSMSAWYVWAALGMYPETPGVPQLVLGSPLFPYMSVSLPHGKSLTVRAPQASAATPYVHHLTVNGHTWTKTWLPASAIRSGATLDYTLAATPDTSWGTRAADAPHSYRAGPLQFPTGLVPAGLTASTPLDVTPGTQTSSTVTFQVGTALGGQSPTASQITSLSWTATPPAGITLTPSSGTLTLGAGGTATATVTASAAAGQAENIYDIPVALTANSSLALPVQDLDVAVVGTGDTATTCTTLGATNTDQGLSQVEYTAGGTGDGATTPVTDGGTAGRETVQLSPNDLNMYFLVDPRVAFDGTFTATFTVTYYDTGFNTWSLQYDSTSSEAAVAARFTDQNSDTWKTVTVMVPDAHFDEEENGSTDLRISSNAPVTVHDVQAVISGPGVLPVDLCPQVSVGTSTLNVTAGAPSTQTLTFQAPAPTAAQITSLNWSATPPAGVTLTPSSGTVTFGADGTATATVTASADAATAQGFYTMPVTFTSDPSLPLPAQQVSVAVIGTGDTADTCSTLADTNTNLGLAQVEYDSGDGVTTPVTEAGLTGRETVLVSPNDLNMYFLVDPRIASNGTFTATFTITYYDTGTNSWNLQYDSASAAYTTALTVTNTNTDTWKTATVTVTDAHFAQRENGGTDFRIASQDPVILHEVQAAVSGPGVPPMDLCPNG